MSDGGVPQNAAMGGRTPEGLPGQTSQRGQVDVPATSQTAEFLSQAGQSLKAGLNDFGDATQQQITNYEKSAASMKGAQAVTRDPTTGQLSVQFMPQLDEVSAAYNQTAASTYNAQAQNDIQGNLQKLAAQNPTDPQAFMTAAQAYTKSYVQNAPAEVRGTLQDLAATEMGRYNEGIFAEKTKLVTSDALQAIDTQASQQANTFLALANQGGANTPDFQKAHDAYKALLQQKVANPLFGYTPAKAAADLKELEGEGQGEAIVGNASRLAQANGAEAGIALADKSIWSPDIDLTEAQRVHYQARAYRQIAEGETQANEARMKLAQGLQSKLEDAGALAATGGDWTSVVKPDDVVAAFGQDKGMEIVQNLSNAANGYSIQNAVRLASPDQLGQMAARLDPTNGLAAGAQPGIKPLQEADAQAAVKLLFPDATITSGARTPEHNAAVGGVPNSMHLAGQALDFTLPNGMTSNDVRAALQSKGLPVTEFLDEGTHIHWGWGAKDGAEAPNVAGGYAQRLKTYQMFQQAVQDRQKALTADPAGYVMQASPQVQTQLADPNPAVVQTGVRSLLQQQSDMGIASPRVLSKPAVSAIVQQFSNSPDPAHVADNMNGVIDGLAQRYGSYFPQVMKELQAGGMPPEAASLYQVRGSGIPAVRMANAINTMSQMGNGDLNKGRDAFFAGAPNNAEIRKAIPTSGLSEYAASFQGNPQGPPQIQSMTNAVNLYARQLAYEGVDPSTAASQAYKDLIGSRYNFQDGYRVPVGVNDALVKQGADAMRGNLQAANLEPHGNPVAGVSTLDRQNVSQSILRSKGVWVTRADDKGLYLAWPAETGYVPAIDQHGKPISYSWSALTAAGTVHPRSTADVQLSGYEAGAGN